MEIDARLMDRAISLAKMGYPSPNPMVGAVIIDDQGEIVGEGYHLRAGLPHAEIEALREARGKGSALYVTLEPCCHYGRTPPCTQAIIGSGIKRVAVGVKDPNPKVNGRGIKLLKERGIEVVEAREVDRELEERCRRLNEIYFKHVQTNEPFVLLKMALTLNGCIKTGERYISSRGGLRYVHELRKRYDAVMIGANTLREDDPELTIRYVDPQWRDPYKIIITRNTSNLPKEAKIWKEEKVLVVCSKNDGNVKEAMVFGGDEVELREAMGELGKMGITGVIIEGGEILAKRAIEEGVVDKCAFLISPKLREGRFLHLDLDLEMHRFYKVGEDLVFEGYVHRDS
jgi:diaminohydroxyphosphoribosylaminopyrimidine deaminase/5-amino-6-(5-phosphoribosylamino)uracil reductase